MRADLARDLGTPRPASHRCCSKRKGERDGTEGKPSAGWARRRRHSSFFRIVKPRAIARPITVKAKATRQSRDAMNAIALKADGLSKNPPTQPITEYLDSNGRRPACTRSQEARSRIRGESRKPTRGFGPSRRASLTSTSMTAGTEAIANISAIRRNVSLDNHKTSVVTAKTATVRTARARADTSALVRSLQGYSHVSYEFSCAQRRVRARRFGFGRHVRRILAVEHTVLIPEPILVVDHVH